MAFKDMFKPNLVEYEQVDTVLIPYIIKALPDVKVSQSAKDGPQKILSFEPGVSREQLDAALKSARTRYDNDYAPAENNVPNKTLQYFLQEFEEKGLHYEIVSKDSMSTRIRIHSKDKDAFIEARNNAERTHTNLSRQQDNRPRSKTQEELVEELLQSVPHASEPTAPEKKPMAFKERQPKKKRIRNVQVMTRLTPEESELLRTRIETTGQSQADFIRSAILTGEIKELPKNSPELIELVASLKDIKANLGKLGGLMKSIIRPNRNNPVITEQEWKILKQQINSLNRLQKEIEKEVNKIWQS